MTPCADGQTLLWSIHILIVARISPNCIHYFVISATDWISSINQNYLISAFRMVEISSQYVLYADDKRIHYLAAGPVNDPLIFFIHGWPGTAITWKPQLDVRCGRIPYV